MEIKNAAINAADFRKRSPDTRDNRRTNKICSTIAMTSSPVPREAKAIPKFLGPWAGILLENCFEFRKNSKNLKIVNPNPVIEIEVRTHAIRVRSAPRRVRSNAKSVFDIFFRAQPASSSRYPEFPSVIPVLNCVYT